MEQIMNYVKPELMILTMVLYFLGMWLKQSRAVKDKYIPLLLGGIGVLFSAIYVFATCSCSTAPEIAMAAFTALTQGVLVAGLSTYINQMIKQAGKSE